MLESPARPSLRRIWPVCAGCRQSHDFQCGTPGPTAPLDDVAAGNCLCFSLCILCWILSRMDLPWTIYGGQLGAPMGIFPRGDSDSVKDGCEMRKLTVCPDSWRQAIHSQRFKIPALAFLSPREPPRCFS